MNLRPNPLAVAIRAVLLGMQAYAQQGAAG